MRCFASSFVIRQRWYANIARSDAGRPTLWPQNSDGTGAGTATEGLAAASASNTSDSTSTSTATASTATTTVYIVDNWVAHPTASTATNIASSSSSSGATTRSIHVYTNAPYVHLTVNGSPAVGGDLTAVPYFGAAVFPAVVFAAGTLTANAVSGDRTTVLGTQHAHVTEYESRAMRGWWGLGGEEHSHQCLLSLLSL